MTTLFKKFGKYDIYLEPSGKFTAEVAGKKISRTSVGALEKELSKFREPVAALRMNGYDHSPSVLNIVKMHANGNFMTDKGDQVSAGGWRDDLRVYDETALDAITDIARRAEALKEEYRQVLARMDKFTKEHLSG